MRIVYLSTLSLVLLAGCSDGTAQQAASVYQDNCASCHGAGLEGGTAPSLFDDSWQHGSDLASIRKNISQGIALVGMPGFEGGLSDAEIEDLIVYLKAGKPAEITDQDASPEPVEPPPELQTNELQINESALVPAIDEIENIEEGVKITDFATGLDEPWGFVFLGPDKQVLVTEKNGKLKRIAAIDGNYGGGTAWGVVAEITGIPAVNNARQGGLLDVAIDRDYAANGWVYLTYSHALEGTSGPSMTKLVRGKIVDDQWTGEEVLFQARSEDYLDTGFHYGSRITFDDKGHLFFSIGDRGPKENAQDTDLPNGKIHRINRDGSIPDDNPFLDGKYPSIYSYGNRNPQGLIWHPETGILWETEHGPKGGDELNAITSGVNYGWPEISYGINYNGTVLTEHQSLPGMAQPVSQWTPSLAVCGLDVYTGDLFSQWKGRLLAGSLAFQSLRLIDVDGNRYVGEVEILKDKGRIRDVTTGPDGAIYVALPTKIVRLSPK